VPTRADTIAPASGLATKLSRDTVPPAATHFTRLRAHGRLRGLSAGRLQIRQLAPKLGLSLGARLQILLYPPSHPVAVLKISQPSHGDPPSVEFNVLNSGQ
jgi:hypothetical protein